MTGISTIENKISSIEKYLTILGGYQDLSIEEITTDPTLKGAIERYLLCGIGCICEKKSG